jgi:hypothetical protein
MAEFGAEWPLVPWQAAQLAASERNSASASALAAAQGASEKETSMSHPPNWNDRAGEVLACIN